MLWDAFKKHLDDLEKQFFDCTISDEEFKNELDNIFGYELMLSLYGFLCVERRKRSGAK